MVLIDREIRALLKQGELVLEPFDERLVQPASVDLRLDGFARQINANGPEIDLRRLANEEIYSEVNISDNGLIIPPGGALVGQTREYMRIPANCLGLIEQRSNMTRIGIQVSSSLINPGYAGNLPTRIVNTTGRPVRIFAGIPFCQLVLLRLTGRPDVIYSEKTDAKYYDERPFLPSKVDEDARKWSAPRMRLVNPAQAADLEKEMSIVEVPDDKV